MENWVRLFRWLWATPWPVYALTMVQANIIGAVFVFAFLRFVLPLDSFLDLDEFRFLNQYLFIGYLVLAFIGGVIGAATGYFMQWYSAVIDYPINVGGRPLHSWPMFIPVTFELTVLFAALTAFFSVLIDNRLPELHHPLFKAPDFDLAMRNRFFLCLRSDDPAFDAARSAALLDSLNPIRRSEVRP